MSESPADLPTVADLADVPVWRCEEPAVACEHGATVTRRLDIVRPIPGDPDHVKVIGRTVDPITLCLVCHHLAPAPQEDPQP